MIGRVVEVAEDGRHIALKRGFLIVSAAGEELGRVPLDDIAVLLCNAHGLTFSNALLVELARRGVAVVLCGSHHAPVAWLWPLQGHHVQALRMRFQLQASRPLRKRLWQTLVRAKILQQKAVLERVGRPTVGFEGLARAVRSGDPENVEAQAARRYWPLLMGRDFRRDRRAGGVNALLNYGYTVLRSGVARAVTSAGLHPSLGLHHHNRNDAMCLVDDLMEPFRPWVDYAVLRLGEAGVDEVTAEAKKALAGILVEDLVTEAGVTPLLTCLERQASSLARSFEEGRVALKLPGVGLPLENAPEVYAGVV